MTIPNRQINHRLIDSLTIDHRTCALCRLYRDREILTPLSHEDEMLIVVDCLICRVPMAVLKAHRASFSDAEKDHVRAVFRDILVTMTGVPTRPPSPTIDHRPSTIDHPDWVIDWEQRQIPDHAHCHLRHHPFPGTTQWEKL